MKSISEHIDFFATKDNQDQLRTRLREVMNNNGYSLSKTTRLIDLSEPTLKAFLFPTIKKTRLEALLKIEKFVSHMENMQRNNDESK